MKVFSREKYLNWEFKNKLNDYDENIFIKKFVDKCEGLTKEEIKDLYGYNYNEEWFINSKSKKN